MKARRTQFGLAVMNAIFLVVVLGTLAVAMTMLSKSEHDTGTKSLLTAKVYFAAKAGLDWGIQQAIAPATPACAASTTFGLTDNALKGINVTVTCEQSMHGAGNFVYYLTSCATTGTSCASPGSVDGPGYAERRLSASVSNIP